MSFANNTPYAAMPVPTIAPDGRDVVVAIVKATFVRGKDGRARLADRQFPVEIGGEVYTPDAVDSSLRFPSDVCSDKRGADVVVVGDAVARKPVKSLDVAVKIRDLTATLRVHGERLYYRGLGGVVVGPAQSFERKPIVYERAYGGTTPDGSRIERRNPVGRGVARDPAALIDTPAPQIEHPAHPITRAGEAPEPVGFGAIAPHWQPRSDFAGTFDEVWKATRMPILPVDFDLRFHNVAHPTLQLAERLRGGDRLAILGMTEEELFQIDVPALTVVLHARYQDGRRESARPSIDTLVVEPALGALRLTLRYAFSMGRGTRLLREIQVDSDD
ncbi:MAG: DUF2169 domain-containing protein [Byssovorax sp.]